MATTWNPADKNAAITLSNGNLTASASGNPVAARATTSKLAGKWYWEVKIDVYTDGVAAGLGLSSAPLNNYIGFGTESWSYYGSSGNYYILHNGSTIATPAAIVTGMFMGFALDLDNNKLYISKNGAWQGGGNPAAGTGGFSIIPGTWFPMTGPVYLANQTGNFGATAFANAAPTGFRSWDSVTQNLAAAATGQATATAALLITRHLAAAASAIASATANSRSHLHFAAAASGLAAASAALRSNKVLGANASIQASGTAALLVAHHLAASAAGNASGSASLSVARPQHHLEAAATGISSATAALSLAHHLEAAAALVAVATADLRLNASPAKHLAAAGQAVASAAASLELLVHLTGDGQAAASAVATLRAHLHLAGAAQSSAGGSGLLRAEQPPPAPPPPVHIVSEATRREFAVITPTRGGQSTPEYAFGSRLFSRRSP